MISFHQILDKENSVTLVWSGRIRYLLRVNPPPLFELLCTPLSTLFMMCLKRA